MDREPPGTAAPANRWVQPTTPAEPANKWLDACRIVIGTNQAAPMASAMNGAKSIERGAPRVTHSAAAPVAV